MTLTIDGQVRCTKCDRTADITVAVGLTQEGMPNFTPRLPEGWLRREDRNDDLFCPDHAST